jgi:hypothetical protein
MASIAGSRDVVDDTSGNHDRLGQYRSFVFVFFGKGTNRQSRDRVDVRRQSIESFYAEIDVVGQFLQFDGTI